MSAALQVPFPAPTTARSLDEWMWELDDDDRAVEAAADEYLEVVQLPAPSIDTAMLAERHLYQVKLIRREVASIKADAAALRARIDSWERRRMTRLERREAWHTSGLMAYIRSIGRKSVDLVSGTIKLVKGRERIEVLDMELFLRTAPAHLIRTKLEPDKPAIMRNLKETGEIPDGTDLIRGDDSVSLVIDD